jgi:hypothetical protein
MIGDELSSHDTRYILRDSIYNDYFLTNEFIIFVKVTSPSLLALASVLSAIAVTGIQLQWFFPSNSALVGVVFIGSLLLFMFMFFALFRVWAKRKRKRFSQLNHDDDKEASFLQRKGHQKIRWIDVKQIMIIGDKIVITYSNGRRDQSRIAGKYRALGPEDENQFRDFLYQKLGVNAKASTNETEEQRGKKIIILKSENMDQKQPSPELQQSQAKQNLLYAIVCFGLDGFALLLMFSGTNTPQDTAGFLLTIAVVSGLALWFLVMYLRAKEQIGC